MTNRQSAHKTKTQQASSILLSALDERAESYGAQVKTCRREFSEEAVHDLRVAARRLLAVLNICRALDPHPRIQKLRRFLKDQLDDLDDLRDVQVMIVDVTESIEKLSDLKPFEIYLQEREKHLLRLARKQTRALKPSELGKRIEKISLLLKKDWMEDHFQPQLLQVADNAYLRAIQALRQIDATQAGTIHRLRLAFKKFRYIAEIVHPLVPDYPETHLKRMHDYQSAMGDIQDLETLLNALAEFSESGASPSDLRPARRYYDKRHAEAIAAFLNDQGELLTFWRATPDQPFLWEKKHDPVHHPSRNRRGSGEVRRRRQPASADGQGPQEDAVHRAGIEGVGDSTRPDPDQSLPASDTNSEHPGEEI